MDDVWIKHPLLPDNAPAKVPACSLPEWQFSGWEVTDEPPPPEPDPDPDGPRTEQPTTEAPAPAGASALPDESPRRRRASTEESK